MTIDFGLALPPGPLPGATPAWMATLDASLPLLAGHVRSLWMVDHLMWNDIPAYEAATTMAYMAARWTQFDVGASVFSQSYRNPALLAKMGATLQILSGGRFIMGIGAGWKEDEYIPYNYPFPNAAIRLEQLGEALEIMKRMWTEPGKVTHRGKHYQVVDAYCEPKPNPAPPIMVGGPGNKTIALAARYADWYNIADATLERFAERLGVIRQACKAIGRDPKTLRLTWFGRLSLGKTEAEARTRATHVGREHYGIWTIDGAFVGTPAQVVEKIHAFADLGVDYFMFEILDLADPDIRDMAIQEVFAKVNA